MNARMRYGWMLVATLLGVAMMVLSSCAGVVHEEDLEGYVTEEEMAVEQTQLRTEQAQLREDFNAAIRAVEKMEGRQGPQGDPGQQGPAGEDGKDGRGIADIFFDDDGQLVIVYSDASADTIELPALVVQPPLSGIQTVPTGTAVLTPGMGFSATAPITLNASTVFTGSVPNVCLVVNTTQEDIDGEMLQHAGSIYENSALGADQCAAAFEGRWYEGFSPSEEHHVTGFMGAVENASVYQGSQWLLPVGTEPRDILYGLAVGKCENWVEAQVEPLPVVFDFVDLDTLQIIHLETTCQALQPENPLPDQIGLIPGVALPHFAVGYGWGGLSVGVVTSSVTSTTPSGTQAPTGVFTGVSQFDAPNKGLLCSTSSAALGDNAVGMIDEAWDDQCLYLLDGVVDGDRAIGLIRGADIASAAASFKASVWPVPASWNGLEWARDFASDNCPTELPIEVYQGGVWTVLETHTCP